MQDMEGVAIKPADVPYRTFLASLVRDLLTGSLRTDSSVPPSALDGDQMEALLAISGFFAPQEAVSIRTRCARGDMQAFDALHKISLLLQSHVPGLIAACLESATSEQWQRLCDDAQTLVKIATCFSLATPLLKGLNAAGVALGNLGDHATAVKVLTQALDVKVEGQQSTYAAIHEMIADEYAALLLFDEAWQQFQFAFSFYQNSDAPPRIKRKQANVLAQQGEYRRAAAIMESQLQGMRDSGISGRELAINLDMCAQYLSKVGRAGRAIEMMSEARTLFEAAGAAARNDLLTNAEVMLSARLQARDAQGARETFGRAYDLAFQLAQEDIDPQHYRQGFEDASKKLLPLSDDAYLLLRAGAAAQAKGDIQLLFDSWDKASSRAAAGGDDYVSLWIKANIAAEAMNLGDYDRALATAMSVRPRAREFGYARPECMVSATLASLLSAGGNADNTPPSIGLMTRACVLLKTEAQLLSTIQLKKDQMVLAGRDTGNVDSILAKAAEQAGHVEIAGKYYKSASEKARLAGNLFELSNRLTGLYRSQHTQQDAAGAAQTIGELELLMGAKAMPPLGRIVGERTLGGFYSTSNLDLATRHMQAASEAAEAYRASLSIDRRRGCDREFRDVPALLAELLRQAGNEQDAFEALQLGKGRDFLDSRERLQPTVEQARNRPLTLKEAQQWLTRLGADSVLLDFAVTTTGITTYCIRPTNLKVLFTAGSFAEFEQAEFGDVEERESSIVTATLNSTLLRNLARQIVAAMPQRARLLIVADKFLHNLPLHAILVDGRPWGELMSFGYAPTAAVLRFARQPTVPPTVLLAGDSVGDLPGARDECNAIGKLFASHPLLGQDCTFAAFIGALASAPQIVHAAIHGRVDVQKGNRSGLLFADAEVGTQWVDIDALARSNWVAPLVVFSGCSTGVIGLKHSTEMLSVPVTVLEAGASSVIASLWPVDDDVAKRLMSSFYARLKAALQLGPVDLREMLDQARMDIKEPAGIARPERRRDGRHIRPTGEDLQRCTPLDTATQRALTTDAFCVFGNPIYG